MCCLRSDACRSRNSAVRAMGRDRCDSRMRRRHPDRCGVQNASSLGADDRVRDRRDGNFTPLWEFADAARRAQESQFFKNLSIIGGFLLLFVTGSGALWPRRCVGSQECLMLQHIRKASAEEDSAIDAVTSNHLRVELDPEAGRFRHFDPAVLDFRARGPHRLPHRVALGIGEALGVGPVRHR